MNQGKLNFEDKKIENEKKKKNKKNKGQDKA